MKFLMATVTIVGGSLSTLRTVLADESPDWHGVCFWDADHNVRKACVKFWDQWECGDGRESDDFPYFGEIVKVCMESKVNYEISYEVVLSNRACECTEENDSWVLSQTKSVVIEVCKQGAVRSCTKQTERKWRYFAYGNDSTETGTGNVHGRDFKDGTYNFTVTWNFDDWDGSHSYKTFLTFVQLPRCDGSENIVLKA